MQIKRRIKALAGEKKRGRVEESVDSIKKADSDQLESLSGELAALSSTRYKVHVKSRSRGVVALESRKVESRTWEQIL